MKRVKKYYKQNKQKRCVECGATKDLVWDSEAQGYVCRKCQVMLYM